MQINTHVILRYAGNVLLRLKSNPLLTIALTIRQPMKILLVISLVLAGVVHGESQESPDGMVWIPLR
jgi:hypothetical protein